VALELPPSYYQKLAENYLVKRDRMLGILSEAGFRCFKPAGAYYIMTDISGFNYPDDLAFSRYLVEKIGIAVVPGSSFYDDQKMGARQVRFTFCKKESTLAACAEKLSKMRAR
jgi:aminotransferase